MLETALINIERIQLLWDTITAHFDCFANCRCFQLRILSAECFSCLAISILESKDKLCGDKKKLIDLQKKYLQEDIWERLILTSMLNYLSSGYGNTVLTILSTSPGIIQQ